MTSPRFVMALVLASTLLAAATAGAQQIYWLDTRFAAPTINRANPDGTSPHSLALPAGSLPEGLVLDPASHSLYWTEADFSGARVRRCYLDLSFPTDVVTGGSAFRGITVNSAGGRLYWTTSHMGTGATIRRANTSGSGAGTVLALPSVSNPRGIAYGVPPAGGAALFVCDPGANTISRYDTNGVQTPLFTTVAGAAPYGVAVDAPNSALYFTLAGVGNLLRSSTTGTGLTVLLSGLAYPTYLALDTQLGNMYWVEGAPSVQHVMRATTTGAGRLALPLPVTSYGGIAFAPASLIAGADAPPIRAVSLDAIGPNPAHGDVRIDFATPTAGPVHLAAYDVQGRQAAVLVDGAYEAGRHTAILPTGRLSAGIYFVRLQAGGATFTRRLVVAD